MSKLATLKRDAFPRVTKRIELSDYAEEFAGDFVEVWLNWSRQFQERVIANVVEADIIKEIGNRDEQKARFDSWLAQRCEIYAIFWSCEPAEVTAIAEADPLLWTWISDEALRLRQEFNETRKKVGSSSGVT